MDLLKIDPNPVAVNASFSVVMRLKNARSSPLAVSVDLNTSSPNQHALFDLAAVESRVVEMTGFYASGGDHSLVAVAKWQTDKTILVPHGTGFTKVPVFKVMNSQEGVVHVLSPTAQPPAPRLIDLGPNQANEVKGAPIAAGVVNAVVGSTDALFAVPKAAGVWRALNGGSWTYLPGSPPRAFSIAIDPNNGSHIAVGERPDDNPDARLGRSGLWESTDFGKSWTYTFDPAPSAASQQVPAVAFARTTSTLLVATKLGVARRARSNTADPFSNQFTYGSRKLGTNCQATNATTPLGDVTAVVASETRLWARTASELFWSDDDGLTWDCWGLQSPVDLPGQPGVSAVYDSAGKSQQWDSWSLAVFDDQAFVIFAAQNTGATGLLTFTPSTRTFVAQTTGDNDGRGFGGHRFVKAFAVTPGSCPALSATIGSGRQVFVGHAQSIQQATGVGTDGRLTFDPYLGSTISGPPIDSRLHSDIWDFLLPTDFCPPTKSVAYIANDGGVYMGDGAGKTAKITAMDWQTHSDGLRAHTAQMVSTVDVPGIVPPPPPFGHAVPFIPLLGVGYPTQDNESWWRQPDGTWVSSTSQGDSNFFVGDASYGTTFSWRQMASGYATLFKPSGDPVNFTLNRPTNGNNQPFDGPAAVQVIQTLAGDATPAALDVTMLVQLPLPDSDGNAVQDPPGGLGSGQRMAIIRNPNFDKAPDGPATKFSGWSIVNDTIPAGARRLWVSGGHATPRYFLYSDENNGACPRGLQRLDTTVINGKAAASWTCLARNLLVDTDTVVPNPPNGNPRNYLGGGFGRQQGPAYVNPYDPKMILIVAAGSGGGAPNVQITLDGGGRFCPLPALSALVTESGRYSIVTAYSPAGAFGAVRSAFHGNPLSVPSHVAFNRQDPTQLMVSSPYTGLFRGSVSAVPGPPARCSESWSELTRTLPVSQSYISGSTFVADAAIVSTEGRGVYAIAQADSAKPATFFQTVSSASSTDPVARLFRADQSPVAWGRVQVTARTADATNALLINRAQIRTDESGDVFLPSKLSPGKYVLDLSFVGDGVLAPSAAKFFFTVP